MNKNSLGTLLKTFLDRAAGKNFCENVSSNNFSFCKLNEFSE